MPPDRAEVTVAIPTYGRPDEIRLCVSALRRQTCCRYHLLILDNASPVPASVALDGLLDDFPASSVRLVRNPVNIGGDANILRCFELCETDYLWVLGDDDLPLPDAIETVLAKLRAYPDGLFLNFVTKMATRTCDTECRDLESFVAGIDSFSNVLFTSTSIFCRRELTPHLRQGFHQIYSMAPHLVLLLRRLMARPGRCVLLSSQIVKWVPPKDGNRWSFVQQALGIGTLLDLPFSTHARRSMAKHIVRPRALEYATVQIAAYRMRSGDVQGSQYLIDQIYSRVVRYAGGWSMWLRYQLCRRVLLVFPRITLAAFRRVVKLTNRGSEMLDFRDPL